MNPQVHKRKFSEISGRGTEHYLFITPIGTLYAIIYFNKAIYKVWEFNILNNVTKKQLGLS
jgi:hypothetical protein